MEDGSTMRQEAPVLLRMRRIVGAAASALVVAAGVVPTEAAWADNVISVSPTSGASNTDFTITVPGPAKCSGDTATQGYRVFSYVVPSSVNPETLNFSGG